MLIKYSLSMSSSSKRLLSLDVFRGITIASMILVNTIVLSPFKMLDHAEWHGCTLADLVFPFFLVIVGISLVLSIAKQQKHRISNPQLIYKILQRTVIIFLLGMILNIFPYHMTGDTFFTVRVYGVLQRIALCYCFAALAYIYLNTMMQVMLTLLLLIGYWVLLMYCPVPHIGAGLLNPAENLGAYIDRLIFNPTNLYGKVFDPEGLLSTLPAIASTLLGNLIAIRLLSRKTEIQKCKTILSAGLVFMVLGWIWDQWFPINKALWTSSYVLWTGGLAYIVFAACYYLIEIKHIINWTKPFEIFGLNAIVAYFMHVLVFKIQLKVHVACGWSKMCNLRQVIIQDMFGWLSLPYASLAYALMTVLFWLLILTILYRRKIFIRI